MSQSTGMSTPSGAVRQPAQGRSRRMRDNEAKRKRASVKTATKVPDPRTILAHGLRGVKAEQTIGSTVRSSALNYAAVSVAPYLGKVIRHDDHDRGAYDHFVSLMESHVNEAFAGTKFLGIPENARGAFVGRLISAYFSLLCDVVSATDGNREILWQTEADLVSSDFFDAVGKEFGDEEKAMIEKLVSLKQKDIYSDPKVAEFWSDVALDVIELEFNPKYGNPENLKHLLHLLNKKRLVKNKFILWILGLFVNTRYAYIKKIVDKKIDKFLVKVKQDPQPEVAGKPAEQGGGTAPSAAPSAAPAAPASASPVQEKPFKQRLSEKLKEAAIEFLGVEDLVSPKFQAIADVIVTYIMDSAKQKINHFVREPDSRQVRFSFNELKARAKHLGDERIRAEWANANSLSDVSRNSQRFVAALAEKEYNFNLWMIREFFRDDETATPSDLKHLESLNEVREMMKKPHLDWNGYVSTRKWLRGQFRQTLLNVFTPALAGKPVEVGSIVT